MGISLQINWIFGIVAGRLLNFLFTEAEGLDQIDGFADGGFF